MAIPGQIRKRSFFLILVIGMALFAFVISGVFTSNGGFGSNKPIGEINGEEIDFEMFNSMVEQAQVVYGLNTIKAVNLAWTIPPQAVMASDFAISRFKYIVRLLLVHGHWNYDRLARMILYFFYKNATFVFAYFWFQVRIQATRSQKVDL